MTFLKKLATLFVTLMMAFSLSGCNQDQGELSSSIELQSDVDFTLLDVLKINNKQSNTIYYYFLASIDNESSKTYYLSNLEYFITDQEDHQIHPIDRYQSTITQDIKPGLSSFVYGYIGYPNANETNVGLEFPRSREFLSFNSVQVREIEDKNISHSDQEKFTVYEDGYFQFDVDSSEVSYRYEDGKSIVDNLHITYINKTDERLVVPFLTPVCTMQAIALSDYSIENLDKMNLEELKKQDFDKNGLPPKTTSVNGTALGYELYYLTSEQNYTCTISFEFDGYIPDFKNDTGKAISININSLPLGYSQLIRVQY